MPGPSTPARHPRDLSEGQRLGLALSVVLAPGPRVLCLDEPTRGLDYDGQGPPGGELRRPGRARARSVVLATHDVELVAEVADRVVLLADGEVVDDGPVRRVVCSSPVFAPQVARVLAPAEWLTVAEVAGALAGERRRERRPRPGASRRGAGRRPCPARSCRCPARTAAIIAATSLVGLAGFLWPLLLSPAGDAAPPTPATPRGCSWCWCRCSWPWCVSDMADGGLDAKAVALLGVLAACGSALRLAGTGVSGFEAVFFLLIPAGRVYGRAFGFVLGALTLFVSALLTGGVGPWLPVPDARCGVDRLRRRLPAPGAGPGRGRAARRLRRGRRPGLRAAAQPVVLALHRGSRVGAGASWPATRWARTSSASGPSTWPPASAGTCPGPSINCLLMVLAGPGDAAGPAAGGPPGRVRRRRRLRAAPSRARPSSEQGRAG